MNDRSEYLKRWRSVNSEKTKKYSRKSHLKIKYKILEEEFERLKNKQNNLCAICNNPPKEESGINGLHIDHCHKKGYIRGLLCIRCNTSLAWYEKYNKIAKLYLITAKALWRKEKNV